LFLWLFIAFFYGLAIGSFLNVVIWRLPNGLSVAAPKWSFCPQCENRLGASDLVPLFSFLALKARCRYCRKPISWRYPAIEFLTGLLFLAVAWRFAGAWDAVVFGCVFTAVLICVFFIDLEHFVIPDGLNILGALVGFAHNAVAIGLGRPGQWSQVGSLRLPLSLVGWLGYAAVVYMIGLISYVWLVCVVDKKVPVGKAASEYIVENVLDWIYLTCYYLGAIIPRLRKGLSPPEPLKGDSAEDIEEDDQAGGMGGGDGKLAAAIGANLGFVISLESFFFAIFIGVFMGMAAMIRRRRRIGERTAIPFGPAMAVGAYVCLFCGYSLLSWYMTLLGHK
jgi:leader peptidase (prepilin peptidase)/N-methyltransferase